VVWTKYIINCIHNPYKFLAVKISHFLRTVPLHLLVEPLLQDEVSGVKSRVVVGQLAVICLGVLRKKFQDFIIIIF